jgi:hypothetical protein
MSLKILFIYFILIPSSFACSTCMVGDPTLNLMGTEKSFEGRLRFSADYLSRIEKMGLEHFNQTKLTEQRLTLGLGYAWDEKLNLSMRLPLVRKQLQFVNLAEQTHSGVGDLDISAKWTLSPHPQHLWGIIGGSRLPTAQKINNLDIDGQSGTGAFVPNLGIWYGFYRYPHFLYASGVYHYAFEGFDNFKAGDAFVSTFAGQVAFNHSLAFQLALETRWSKQNTTNNQTDPDSGGTLGFLSPKIIYSITPDILLNVGVQIPVIKKLKGNHQEERTLQFGVIYDF